METQITIMMKVRKRTSTTTSTKAFTLEKSQARNFRTPKQEPILSFKACAKYLHRLLRKEGNEALNLSQGIWPEWWIKFTRRMKSPRRQETCLSKRKDKECEISQMIMLTVKRKQFLKNLWWPIYWLQAIRMPRIQGFLSSEGRIRIKLWVFIMIRRLIKELQTETVFKVLKALQRWKRSSRT